MTTLGEPVLFDDLDGEGRRAIVWRLGEPMLSIASAPLGGGIGLRDWIVNVQVDEGYARTDLEDHLQTIASQLGCAGAGIGFLTAADVARWTSGEDGGVRAYATVGLREPMWAAGAAEAVARPAAGTINIVVGVPARLSDAALVNAVTTTTEAKAQALADAGVPGTGTASDAVCVLCGSQGVGERFAGPRSTFGACIARAVHAAVAQGVRAWREQPAP